MIDTDPSITSNTLNVSLAKFFTPDTTQVKSYNLYYNNRLLNPHTEHNKESGGIVASTGFGISGQTGLEFFFDDDGAGNLRIYRLVEVCELIIVPQQEQLIIQMEPYQSTLFS